jgi:type VI secretion system protein ImpJ
VLAENYIVVPLEKRDDGMYLGKFEDPKLPRTHELFLEAKGIDEGTLRERLPRLLKIGSWTQIGYILNAAMPGVACGGGVPPPRRHPRSSRVWSTSGSSKLAITGTTSSGSGTIAIYQPIEPQKVDLRLIGVQVQK